MIASVESSAKIALMIGSSIETTVPNVNVRITIAAMIPISSLDSVDGFGDLLPELAAGLAPPARPPSPGSARVDDLLRFLARTASPG